MCFCRSTNIWVWYFGVWGANSTFKSYLDVFFLYSLTWCELWNQPLNLTLSVPFVWLYTIFFPPVELLLKLPRSLFIRPVDSMLVVECWHANYGISLVSNSDVVQLWTRLPQLRETKKVESWISSMLCCSSFCFSGLRQVVSWVCFPVWSPFCSIAVCWKLYLQNVNFAGGKKNSLCIP